MYVTFIKTLVTKMSIFKHSSTKIELELMLHVFVSLNYSSGYFITFFGSPKCLLKIAPAKTHFYPGLNIIITIVTLV